ncbi:MAG TPA: metallophosphoesterase, partial [Chthonomonadales bacterium]|nr:metallophosphoesterase [Chthonomonadales bacterium]
MRRSCILLTISLLLAGVHGARGQGFSFLHITDTHVGAAGREQALGHLAAAVGRMSPKPAFVVNTGDLTDLGTPEQLRRYAELASALTVPSHAVPGSHDVRWSPTVKAGFEATVGPRHRSFQHGGCHFVLLDSTIALSHRGHIDRAQLRWLQGDLRRLRRGTPVFVFVHHPVGRMPRQIENEDELLRILAPYRVAALFAGHGHADAAWTVNGIPVFMARGLHEGSYHRVEVGDEKVRVLRAIEGPDRPVEIASLPLAGRPAASVAFAWDDAQVPLLARRRFVAELRDERGRATDDRVTAEYAIGGAAPQPMERDARDKESVSFMAQFATRELVAGAHALTVILTAADGVVYRREESFVVERLQGEPRFAWETPFPAGDAVRSSVAPSSNGVVFGSLDGRLTSLSIGHGRRRWVASTRAPV